LSVVKFNLGDLQNCHFTTKRTHQKNIKENINIQVLELAKTIFRLDISAILGICVKSFFA
jgi:hypothetical protein